MLLFRSPHKAKITFDHNILTYILDKSFCAILEYICFFVHVIVLADIHTICVRLAEEYADTQGNG